MEIPKGKDYCQFYSNRYNIAVEEENYEEALDYAIKGYLIAKDIEDKILQQMFLFLLRSVVNDFIEKSLKKKAKEAKQDLCCSFCGRKADDVKLMAGAHGSICQSCAAQVHEYFTKEQ